MESRTLYDSHGNFRALQEGDGLYNADGRLIGHFVRYFDIFVDTEGKYLGEVVQHNRLMFRHNSRHTAMSFPIQAYHPTMFPKGIAGAGLTRHCQIGPVPNFEDISDKRMEPLRSGLTTVPPRAA